LTPRFESAKSSAHIFCQEKGMDGKIFEEKLFILIISTMFLQIFFKMCVSGFADDILEFKMMLEVNEFRNTDGEKIPFRNIVES
jgi:hypothetical protein